MGRKAEDLTGKRFGMLTVIKRSDNHGKAGQNARWICKCDCGNLHEAFSHCLKKGSVKSCGCLLVSMHTTHGYTDTPLYNVWNCIKQRCINPNYKNWDDYGGRGIKLYEEWRKDFVLFRDYVMQLPHYGEEGYSIDRIDNNGNYEPGNIRFATKKEQALNRRNTAYYEENGIKITLKDLALISGIPYGTLLDRRYNKKPILKENEREILWN